MTDLEQRFHETWLGMVQPIEGLVVSVPVLVEAQCMARQKAPIGLTLGESKGAFLQGPFGSVTDRSVANCRIVP